ncbi:E3 ubiquitin-protein ligase MYCBP2-like [Mytilus californianus]|uniref:E3 ubiquitin-protein ligase MYCBP2-like n=1 Tax=Mytilus californianus TaxID=6549 RepID=UPI00224605DC|nr:E3 ubiquitin-protein ligase MYCBP2-like [Mytilus californianus]
MEFCGKICMHGHPCRGLKDENSCVPCLSCNNANQKHTANDMCMICYTEPLPSFPCIKLECDHIFHYECVRQILEKRWIGPRITFGFSLCPICKTRVSHPSLEEVLQPINCLFGDVKTKSLTRLEYEGLFKCDAINKPGGIFYQDPARYAMERYAYYECSKCGKAYYGGEGRCEHDHDDDFNPADLVCGGCVDISREQECPKHGKDFIEFKCRYCCSIAVFYCFGTTHFCNTCHNNHTVVTNMSKPQLPQCPAAPLGKKLTGTECPLGLQHPPTGDEFSLGCALCKNLQCF